MNSSYCSFPFDLAKDVRLLILDVDGVLTQGTLFIDDDGKQAKGFHVRDGHGMKMLQRSGIEIAILTGRTSGVVECRAKELGIEYVIQGSLRKSDGLDRLCAEAGVIPDQCAYMGDDVVDLPAMRRCRLALAPHNAHFSVQGVAHWCSAFDGGAGAVRQACEGLILASDAWQIVVEEPYGVSPEDCGWKI